MVWQQENQEQVRSHTATSKKAHCTAQPPSLPPTQPPLPFISTQMERQKGTGAASHKGCPQLKWAPSSLWQIYLHRRRMSRAMLPALRKLGLVYTQRSCPPTAHKYMVCSGTVIHVHIYISVCSRCNSHANAHVYGEHCRFFSKNILAAPLYLIM